MGMRHELRRNGNNRLRGACVLVQTFPISGTVITKTRARKRVTQVPKSVINALHRRG